MRWLLAKIGLLTGTACAAVAGAAASQTVAFVEAYLQRLGGHIDEVVRTLAALRSGEMAASVSDPAARGQLIDAFAARLAELEASRDAIQGAGVFLKPAALLIHMDREIAARTADSFTPAIPLDLPSAVFALIGIALAWAVWEAASWPVRRRFGRSRRLPTR